MRIALAQINLTVGDIEGNRDRIIDYIRQARDIHAADLVVFPELALTGYPPDDLLLRRSFMRQVSTAMDHIAGCTAGIEVILGYPESADGRLYNSACCIRDARVVENYRKQDLPNYGVFDEKRYFTPGHAMTLLQLQQVPTALTICEDIWTAGPARQAGEAGARLLININASPYHIEKMDQRLEILRHRVAETGLSILYLNMVGGQDEVVFDGGSMFMDAAGTVLYQAPVFSEGLYTLDLQPAAGGMALRQAPTQVITADRRAVIYGALVTGVRDYVRKNGFRGAVIGLSGGIDSALTLAIAVDALGSENVEVMIMPSRYTAAMSIEDSVQMADRLSVKHHTVSIEEPFQAFTSVLAPLFAGSQADVTEENIQARCRGILLMAVSNKTGKLVLTTGNKSEMAVGYATLYGDMAGGFAPLKDVSKTLVYELSNWLNRDAELIPQRIIDRPPSAELRPDQKDQDSLPPYDVLDSILEQYIELDCSPEQMIKSGMDPGTVQLVVRLIDRNEYKRRQAAPGVKITRRAFGRDRRYPITSGYTEK